MESNANHKSHLLSYAISLSELSKLREEADKWYNNIDDLIQRFGTFKVAEHLPENAIYLPTASSIALNAVMLPETLINAFSPTLKQHLLDILGPEIVCDTDIAWLRRQYPPSTMPQYTSPHGWHQDGAYGINFLNNVNNSDKSLLPMVTVWLPIHECGQTAPGIELIVDSPTSTLLPWELSEERISKQWSPDDYWQPLMQPGDALIIMANTLHRTYTTHAMTQLRGCVELRFLPANNIPHRVASHNFMPCFFKMQH